MRRPTDRRHDRRTDREPPINGPTPDEIAGALEALRDGHPRTTPRLADIRPLLDAGISTPITLDDREIRTLEIQRGAPMHGAKRSDDHISGYEVEYMAECPEDCPSSTLRFEYDAHHHIAGYHRTVCPMCDTEHEREEWG